MRLDYETNVVQTNKLCRSGECTREIRQSRLSCNIDHHVV